MKVPMSMVSRPCLKVYPIISSIKVCERVIQIRLLINYIINLSAFTLKKRINELNNFEEVFGFFKKHLHQLLN